jgi:hypothetical protein
MLISPRQIEGTPKPTYPKGRRCRGCNYFLSIYNRRWYCAQCRPEGRRFASLERQSERDLFGDTIKELMEA